MRSTKKAFLLSMMSMLLCVAMLMGTTFAWFTDSVTSGKNKIVAGNLDIDVKHTNAKVTTAESIEGKTNLFYDVNGNAMLWEPGAISFENFTVENLGSLAFKYNLALAVADYNAVSGTGKTLKDILKVKVLTGDDILSTVTRETVMDLDWTTSQSIDDFKKDNGKLYPVGTTGQPSTETFQVIIYWQPSANDNDWNVNNGKTTTDGQPLFIEFGVNVVATQLDYENDSFGDDYDENVITPNLPASINKTFESTPISGTTYTGSESVKIVNKNDNSSTVATVPATAVKSIVEKAAVLAEDLDTTKDVNTTLYLSVTTNNEDVEAGTASYNIDLTATMTYTDTTGASKSVNLTSEQVDEVLGNQIVTATINIGKGLNKVTVKHNGDPMTKLASATTDSVGYFYDFANGDLTIKTSSFSPFVVEYEVGEAVATIISGGQKVGYYTLEDAIAGAKNGETVVLSGDVALSATQGVPALLINKSITLDGNGNTLTVTGDSTSDSYGIYVNADETICATIKNLTLNTTRTERAIRFGGKAGGIVENVIITTEAVGIHVKGTGEVTMNSVDVTVNAIPAFTAHKRAGVVVGAETTATLNNSKVTVVTPDKTNDTLTWGKGLYVGTNAKGKLIVNNSEVTADFALAIDGSSDQGKLNNITVNSGKISGDLGSPGGYSYKEIVIQGGIFNPYSVNGMNSSFADKTTATHRMIITGGSFSVEPDAKYIADGYSATETEGTWTVSLTPASELPRWSDYADKNGVVIDEDNKTIAINTAEGLAWFANSVTTAASWSETACNNPGSFFRYTVNIMNDIDLGGKLWVPIWMWYNGCGDYITINGNGHTIKNMRTDSSISSNILNSAVGNYRYTGFISVTATCNITINDLKFDSSIQSGNNSTQIGVVIGLMNGNITLKNVDVNNAKIIGEGTTARVGALVGQIVNDGPTSLNMTNCDITNCDIKGYNNVGGFIGTLPDISVTATNCTIFNTTITGTAANAKAAGAYACNGYDVYDAPSGITVTNVTVNTPNADQ